MNWWQRFKKSSAHTQANIVCTIMVMVATIAYTVIARFQLGTMKGQLAEMQSATQATQIAAVAARDSRV